MTPEQFVKTFYPYAKKVQDRTGISAVALLAQSAHETGWGKKAVGNMMFGVKDTDGINGNEQLITTTEYVKNQHTIFPVVLKKTFIKALGKWKLIVKDWFRKYDSAEQSFFDHAEFLRKNPRYKVAMTYKENATIFLTHIARAGYATDPNYEKLMMQMVDSINKRLPKK